MTESPPDPASLEFASLLCSRICHDLLNPVGGLNNGLEMLAEETDSAGRAMVLDLVARGARESADKLKFFRLAFGASGGFGELIDARDMRGPIEALSRRDKHLVALGWLLDVDRLPRGAARILMNLALIALDGLVRGGRLDVGVEQDELVVRAEGPRLVIDAEVRATLAGEGDVPLSTRTIGAVLARTLAEREGRQLLVSQTDGVLILGASRPAPAGAR